MEAHQSRVVSAITVTQQVPADVCFAQLTVEAQLRSDFLLTGQMTIGGIGDGIGLAIDYFAND
jgi:hypothetical protein